MTRNDIIKLALDAGGRMYASDEVEFFLPDLERFTKLIYEATFRDANIAASRTIIDAAVRHEREACAKVCDHMASRCNDIRTAALEVAAENIRARSNT